MFGLSQIQLIIIGGLLAVVITTGGIAYIYNKGEKAGSSTVTTAVQKKSAETLDKARTTKERADEEVRSQPYSKTVDELK